MGKTKILIADDSPHIQELFHDLFVDRGYEVAQAFNGEDAINAFDREKPEVALLDIMMPRHNGLEVLRYIKKKSPDTVVIMMTAHGSEETAVEAMKLGADDYLVKPLSYKEVLGVVEDLLEKNRIKLENIRLREKVHKTERYLAHLIDNVNEAIISTDPEGRIQSFNRAAERLWGVSEKEVLGSHISVLFKNGEKNGYVGKLFDITKGEGKYSGEFLFTRKDGSQFPGFLSTTVMGEDEDGGGIVAVIRDLTNEKRLREQIIESTKLASLGKVVEGIAHEVRNPLISIGGFARRMAREMEEKSSNAKYIKAMLQDVNRLEKMVADIEEYVDFARRHKSDCSAVDVRDVIIDSLSDLDLNSAGIELDLDEAEVPKIYGDRKYLKELFDNLLENAIEAMPGGGKLTVRFRVENNFLVVDISDTGCGIPKEKLDDIYDPFYTSKMSGIGIGLAKVYMIVEEHHGFISVNSVEGKGTTFTLRFPLERRQEVRT